MVEITDSSQSTWDADVPMVLASILPNDDYDNYGDARFEVSTVEADNVGGSQSTRIPGRSSSSSNSARTLSCSSSSSSSVSSPSSSPIQLHNMDHISNFLETQDGCRNDAMAPMGGHVSVSPIPFNNDDQNPNTNNRGNNANANVNAGRTIDNNVTLAAGAAGCVIGFMTGGFFWILICGSVVAHSSTQDGVVGDVARALGDVAITARNNFVLVDKKHHIVHNTKVLTSNALIFLRQQLQKAEENDPEIDAFLRLDGTSKIKYVLTWLWKKMKELDRRHHLIERATIEVKELTITSYKLIMKIAAYLCQERQQQ